VSFLASSVVTAQSSNDGGVVRLDPALDALVSPDAKIELVKGGFGFTEGPVWVQEGREGYLLFTDMPGNVIWKLMPDGKASVHLTNVGYNGPEVWRWGGIQNNGRERTDPGFEEFAMIGADGLTLDRQGRLIVATFAGRSLMRVEKNGQRTVLADRYEGKRFGGPNDVVVKRDGAIYFTDTYGAFRLREKDPRRELDFNAVYMWKDGKLTLVVKDMPTTNGLAFSPTSNTSMSTAGATTTSTVTMFARTARSPTASCSSTCARKPGAGSPTACESTPRAISTRLLLAACGSSRRKESTSAPSARRKCLPMWDSAAPTRRRSTSPRARASTRSE
jgi:sugar lactone lactonase YvrE